jgi:hypothetical protein
MEKYKKGDLVGIKFNTNSKKKEIKIESGLVVEVLTNNSQEPLWNAYLILFKGIVDSFPARRLVSQYNISL